MIFLISLMIVIIMHELAHFGVALLCKCRVEEVSLGFGKLLYSIEYKKIKYSIRLILMGGYCKLKDELSYSRSKYAFSNLRYMKKVAISMAGIVVNVIAGAIAMALGWFFGSRTLLYFGLISIALGITNAIPFPALDGSYPFLVLLEKRYGKKKGYMIMNKICKIGFIILMALNIAFLPLMIYYLAIGRL